MESKNAQNATVTAYRDKLCTRADDIYRLGYYFYYDRNRAKKYVDEVFSKIVLDISSSKAFSISDKNNRTIRQLYSVCWDVHVRKGSPTSPLSREMQVIFGNMSVLQHALFVFVDVVGLSSVLVQNISDIDGEEFDSVLSDSRRIFIER